MKLTEEAMRNAVATRDSALDGQFFFGVVTTGIYCRPVCRSRAPRPENLRFFADTRSAEDAGFRACKRCRPASAPETADRGILQAARFLLANPESAGDLRSLAARAHLSPAHFQRRFKKLLGASPRQFQEAVRLGRLKQLLRGQAAVSHALLDAGFASQSPGYRAAQRALGMSPAQFRRGGQGEPIDYLTAHCELGELMIAATAQGVCFVQFGADADELKDLLAQEFPRAELRDAAAMSRAAALRGWLKALVRTIDRGAPLTRIPLDLRGTAFQIRVWRELQKISSGATRSYAQVAARLKMPRAVRAVASACARNRIAVLVPCHRVLRGDGELAGYRWGLQRKRALLDKEAAKATKAD